MGQDYNIFEDSNDSLGEIENSNHSFQDYSGEHSSSINQYGLSPDEYMEEKGYKKPLRWQYNSDEEYRVVMEEYEDKKYKMVGWKSKPIEIAAGIFSVVVLIFIIGILFSFSSSLGIVGGALIVLYVSYA